MCGPNTSYWTHWPKEQRDVKWHILEYVWAKHEELAIHISQAADNYWNKAMFPDFLVKNKPLKKSDYSLN